MPTNPGKKYPLLDPETDCCLYRSLRYDLETGTLNEQVTDLYALRSGENPPVYYFRHQRWCDAKRPGICQITSRDEAARFLREQLTKPGLFSSWNHKEIHAFLPEVYGKGSDLQ